MSEVLLLIIAVAFFARRGRGRRGNGPERLPAILAGAEAAGIITHDQHTALLAYAGRTAEREPRLGGVAWLGVFAGLFVVAGIALLIARNWADIGPGVRVAGFLALLAAMGEAAIRYRGRSVAASVPLELVWFFLPLLGIGLYAQTFQLSGDPIQPFLVWLALGAPLAWLSERPVVAMLHTFALVSVLFAGNYLLGPASALIGVGDPALPSALALTDDAARPAAWALSIALLGTVGLQSVRLLPRAHRHHFVGVWAVWVFCLLVAPTPFRLRHEGWIVLAALGLVTLWVVVVAALDTSFEERAASVSAWLLTLYALTFTWHMDRPASGSTTTLGLMVAGAAIVGAIGSTLALPWAQFAARRAWALGAKAMLVLPIATASLYLVDDVRLAWLAAGVMNVLLVAVAVGLMWHGSLAREAAQVNLGVLVLVGVLITRFLDVFGNMLRSGIGFIAAGLLLAGLAWALERTRRRLLAGAPGMAP